MYGKLILRSARRSVQDYLIYLVTLTLCVGLFYAFLSISSRYYHPALGAEFDLSFLSEWMKLAICGVTLLLLFLIRYVNRYMIRQKQQEFAMQTILGMEQRTTAWLFFGETFLMGLLSLGLGIPLGSLLSQFITAMLLSSYGQSFQLSWALFPDTAALTLLFFSLSFFVVGLFNVRSIQKLHVIDMLQARRKNEDSLKKSRWMPVVTILYLAALAGIAAMNLWYASACLYWPVSSMCPMPYFPWRAWQGADYGVLSGGAFSLCWPFSWSSPSSAFSSSPWPRGWTGPTPCLFLRRACAPTCSFFLSTCLSSSVR